MGIALVLLGEVAAYSYGQFQFFNSVRKLDVQVSDLQLRLTGQPLLIVQASVSNPTGFNGFRLWSFTYVIFIGPDTDPRGPVAADSGTIAYQPSPVIISAGAKSNLKMALSPYAYLGNLATFVN